MPNCPKCGAKVTEAMSFCPSCGSSLKVAQPVVQAPAPAAPAPAPTPQPHREEKHEKQEKEEKHEKGEKTEKHEKRQYGPIGPIIAGIVLIALGLIAYLSITLNLPQNLLWAWFFIVVGITIVLAALYAAVMASRRHPPT
jgi:cation transport ATPase